MRKVWLVLLVVAAFVVASYGLAGCTAYVAYPLRVATSLNDHSRLVLMSERGSLGIVVITSDDPALITKMEQGRAYVPSFDRLTGPLLFWFTWQKRYDWPYVPSDEVAAEDLSWEHFTETSPIRLTDVYFPFWVPAVLLAFAPIRALIRGPILRDFRRSAGRCPRCGYNLQGCPSPRCPECGKAIRRPQHAPPDAPSDSAE